jgi:hypothetical protein
MKSYNETIVKKGKYKNHFEVEIYSILNYPVGRKGKASNWQEVEEDSFNLDLVRHIWEEGEKIYGFDDMLKQAKEYIGKKTGVNKLDNLEDDIKQDIFRALSDSYENSYLTEAFDWVKKEIEENLTASLNSHDIKDYQILYYSEEDKTLHSEFKYNSSKIYIYLPVKEIKNIATLNGWEDYTLEEVINEFPYYFEVKSLNWEYFDYYGTRGNYDDWFECFKDCEETSYKIEKLLEKRREKVKAYIKNKVEISKRELLEI